MYRVTEKGLKNSNYQNKLFVGLLNDKKQENRVIWYEYASEIVLHRAQ